jgi:hypothetical protein
VKTEVEIRTRLKELNEKLKACNTVGGEVDMGFSAEITALEWVLGEKEGTKLWPKYLMKINGRRQFLTLGEAGRAYDNGMVSVEFGRYVLSEDFSVVPMNDTDRKEISDAADRYSESK